jgi:hypothetical protein
MLRKLSVAGLVAGAALSALAFAAPAHADANSGDQQFNQNLQVIPITACNVEVNVIAVPIDVLSPNTTGDCVNGSSGTNVKSETEVEVEKHGHKH